MSPTHPNITFIGFGEAAQAFAKGLCRDDHTCALTAFDAKTATKDAYDLRVAYEAFGVHGALDTVAACSSADLIFSLVTADQADVAATQASQSDLTDRFYLDCNSCAPETKRRAAHAIEAAGGRYVDVAIMTPVHPNLHKAPCLLAGPHADAAKTCLDVLGMSTTIAGDRIGDASTRKMVRSVMVKGLEALTLECFLAARKAGIEGDILASLDKSYPGFDWPQRAPYMIERALTHGARRAAEMHEASKMLSDLGIDPHMTDGTIERQQHAGSHALSATEVGAEDLSALTGAMLVAVGHTSTPETKGDLQR